MSSQKILRTLFISINNTWRYGNIGMDQLLGYLRNKGFYIDIAYYRHKQGIENICNHLANKSGYSIYGFYVNSSNYAMCCAIAKNIKNCNNSAIIVFGGGYATRYYREILDKNLYPDNNIDYIILGDGEQPTEYLLGILTQKLICGKNNKVDHESIAFHGSVEGKKECLNTLIDWHPAYDYYEKDSFNINSRKVHCIQIKNNVCTGMCAFCTERHGKVVYKNIKMIVSQIIHVSTTYNVKKIFFTDDNILDPNNDAAKKHLWNLCMEIRKNHLRLAFQCYIKASSLQDIKADHELLDLMHEVGFREIFIGIESGNQEDLLLYNKYTTVEQNRAIIDIIRQHDIFPIIGFIAYNPYSTRDRITKNFQYLCDIECTYLHNYIYSSVVINKYTKLYDMIKVDRLLDDDEQAYLDVKYSYKHDDVVAVVKYVREDMVPKLRKLDYELDWIIYSMMEHEIWYPDLRDYRKFLMQKKKEDAAWIKRKLSLLFVDFDVNSFKKVSDDFWKYFYEEEKILKEIYDYYISLHYQDESVLCNADEKQILDS